MERIDRGRLYSDQVSPAIAGKVIVIAGWVHEVRNLGGISFVIVRDRQGTVQVTLPKKKVPELFELAAKLSRESVIAVRGEVKASPQAKAGVEILPSEIQVLSAAKTPLPLGVTDQVNIELETRLDSRFLDLRRPAPAAVFRIRSTILHAIRAQLEEDGFIEVNTPKIVATATEGGAALFPMQYFEHKAYLNQSPQLYKQMLMAAGFDRVFEIGPAFRAEEHNTPRHLNEFTSIDIEMSFANEEDVMGVLERVIHRAAKDVRENRARELDALGIQLEVPALPFPRVTYSQCIEHAREKKIPVRWGEDLSMEATRVVAEEYPSYYFITRWPSAIKPFYILPFEDAPDESRSFDLQFAEKEITSGGQRVHDPEILKQRLAKQGLDPEAFRFYVSAFEYGMPPHAGWGLGADRTVMILTKRDNVRECVLFPRDRTRLSP